MDILLLLTAGTLNIVCFFVGAKIAQKVSKGETISVPALNPMKAIQERREKKELDKKQAELDTILRNIERYDGTGIGQEDVPRG